MTTNKVALVTGASRGIGRAIALKLAQDGFNVMINYAGNLALALAVKAECKKFGVCAAVFQANIGNKEEVAALIKATIDEFGTVDVLINNAGITRDNLMLRMSDEDFDEVIDTNLKGVFYLTKAVSKLMFKKRSGKIVNLTSVSGVTGNVGQANYAASKAGVIGLTKTVAKELAPRDIQVNAVAPGFIQTDMTDVLGDDLKAKIQESVPLKRLGVPEDIANMVAFLVSDNANYITGQIFHVDGGLVM
jgi:3-oxoacyl-[acyl-carrier protein] reductase